MVQGIIFLGILAFVVLVFAVFLYEQKRGSRFFSSTRKKADTFVLRTLQSVEQRDGRKVIIGVGKKGMQGMRGAHVLVKKGSGKARRVLNRNKKRRGKEVNTHERPASPFLQEVVAHKTELRNNRNGVEDNQK